MAPIFSQVNFFKSIKNKFIKDERGTIAVVTAIVFIPILLGVGMAIDYIKASNARASLTAIADAATLAGVSDRGVIRLGDIGSQKMQVAAAARTFFNSQLDNKPGLRALNPTFDVTMTDSNNVVTVRLCYSAETRSMMGSVTGRKAFAIAGCSQAASSFPEYISIHAIIDASGSMGIGASVNDQLLMQKRLGCAFACHDGDPMQPLYSPQCNTFNQWAQTPNCARMIGAKTRFDIARESLLTMIEQAQALTRWPNQFSFSIHKFATRTTEVHASSSNLSSVRAAVQSMTLERAGAQTDMRLALQTVLPKIPTGGDGTSPTKPKVYLILISDGVESIPQSFCSSPTALIGCSNWAGGILPSFQMGTMRKQPINPSGCAPFKQKNVTVMMLYTEYATPPGTDNEYFRQVNSMFMPHMRTLIQACASKPDLAYYATNPGQIRAASDRIFKTIAMPPGLTQ